MGKRLRKVHSKGIRAVIKKQKLISTKLHNFVNSSEENYNRKMPHEFHKKDNNIISAKDKKIFICPYCDKKITLYHNLKTHIENTHPNEKIGEKIYKKDESKIFICPYCEKKITLYHNMKTHIENTHLNEKNGEKICKKDESNKR